jgi:hypothetical protein
VAEDRPPEVLGSLPRTRPHRRSDKRAARPTAADPATAAPAAEHPIAAAAAEQPPANPSPAKARTPKPKQKPRLRQPAQPSGTPAGKARRGKPPARDTTKPQPVAAQRGNNRSEVLGTAVQAAAELAELGLAVSARAIRGAIQRLPRP